MAQVLWVTAVLSNITVIQRIVYTWQETKRMKDAEPEAVAARAR
jgi:hypothetical protein